MHFFGDRAIGCNRNPQFQKEIWDSDGHQTHQDPQSFVGSLEVCCCLWRPFTTPRGIVVGCSGHSFAYVLCFELWKSMCFLVIRREGDMKVCRHFLFASLRKCFDSLVTVHSGAWLGFKVWFSWPFVHLNICKLDVKTPLTIEFIILPHRKTGKYKLISYCRSPPEQLMTDGCQLSAIFQMALFPLHLCPKDPDFASVKVIWGPLLDPTCICLHSKPMYLFSGNPEKTCESLLI